MNNYTKINLDCLVCNKEFETLEIKEKIGDKLYSVVDEFTCSDKCAKEQDRTIKELEDSDE